jgi:hypothetical protein
MRESRLERPVASPSHSPDVLGASALLGCDVASLIGREIK